MITEYIDDAIERLIDETVEKGGSTVHVTGRPVPKSGFMVGGVVDPLIFQFLDVLNPTDRANLTRVLFEYVSQYNETLSDRHYFLGAWIDQKEGRLYIDVSQHVIVKQYAEELAKERGELAIWDVANSAEIRL
jgi:hypothetical protein